MVPQDVNEAAEKTVTTHEAMQSLDVVYNFLIQNSDSQSALTALEEVMSFVDGKHKRTAVEGDKRQQDVFVKEEMFDDEGGDKCVLEMDNAEMDHGVVEDDDSTNIPLRDRGANSSDDEVDPLSYLEMGNSPELEEHGVAFNDSSFGKSSGSKDQAKTRTSYSILEKQDIIKRYDVLPKMSNQKKARMLGVKYSSLLNIVSKREEIFSTQGCNSINSIDISQNLSKVPKSTFSLPK